MVEEHSVVAIIANTTLQWRKHFIVWTVMTNWAFCLCNVIKRRAKEAWRTFYPIFHFWRSTIKTTATVHRSSQTYI